MSRHPYPTIHPSGLDEQSRLWQEYERQLLEWYPRRPPRRPATPALLLARAVLVAVFAIVILGLPPLLRSVGGALG